MTQRVAGAFLMLLAVLAWLVEPFGFSRRSLPPSGPHRAAKATR